MNTLLDCLLFSGETSLEGAIGTEAGPHPLVPRSGGSSSDGVQGLGLGHLEGAPRTSPPTACPKKCASSSRGP